MKIGSTTVFSVERSLFCNRVLGSTVADFVGPMFVFVQHWWHWQILASYRCTDDNVRHTKTLCIKTVHGK